MDTIEINEISNYSSHCVITYATMGDFSSYSSQSTANYYWGRDYMKNWDGEMRHADGMDDFSNMADDNAWINASNYGAPEQLFTGEIGRIDDTRFIETTLMCNGKAPSTDPAYKQELAKGQGETANATDVYQAVIFGDQYYGIAWSLPVELRDNGVEDFGRKRSLAWYAIWGTGLLHNDYGVVIETA